MKTHRSLATERVAVRRCANAGKCLRETHGLLGNLRKLYYAAAKWGHQALLTGIQEVYEKIRASVRFIANLCPACISGARHDVRWSTLPSNACQTAHRATVRSGHHSTTGTAQTAQRHATWASSASDLLRPVRFQTGNRPKPYTKVNYGHQCRQGTKEDDPR